MSRCYTNPVITCIEATLILAPLDVNHLRVRKHPNPGSVPRVSHYSWVIYYESIWWWCSVSICVPQVKLLNRRALVSAIVPRHFFFHPGWSSILSVEEPFVCSLDGCEASDGSATLMGGVFGSPAILRTPSSDPKLTRKWFYTH
jgi:hypothetical protein